MKKTTLQGFRLISLIEGLSFLLLLGIAMPLKYWAGIPELVSIIGAVHGALFVLYLAAVVVMAIVFRWRIVRILGALAASVLPFGPFILDSRLKKEYA